jgi:phenylacetate-CoA ligase
MDALRIYHALPYPFKVALASIKGRKFSSWRYGAETEKLIEEATERESWSEDKWSSWQDERLAFILHRAATRVPYYRDQWQERRRKGDNSSWEILDNWPVLTKEPLRVDAKRFVADDCNREHMWKLTTSGTSGISVDLWWSRKTTTLWYALFEARWRRWYDLHWKERWAYFGGKMVASPKRMTPPFWVWNPGMRQLYMSSYHLSPNNSVSYIKALKQYRVEYLFGYASSIYAVANDILEQGLVPPAVKAAVTCAEPLYDYQRETISKAFSCPVFETYGMAEIVAAAGECKHESLHWWPEVGVLEVIENDAFVGKGVEGDLITTGLFNPDMPLIRLKLGDRGRLPEYGDCACGRKLPILPKLEGRCDDVVVLPDGKRIGRFSTIFKGDIPFREFQVVQEELNSIRVLAVPTEDYVAGAEKDIEQKLRDKIGYQIQINFEFVDSIPRTKNGKFRGVISKLPRH